jgi:hypothetical protein
MTRIAIMQPYFIPYAGYFRLFAATDLFVIYDCVQFIRRGWIHRNRLTNQTGELDWLTLPLKKAPQDILIRDIAFAEDMDIRWKEEQRRFPVFKGAHPLLTWAKRPEGTPLAFIEKGMKQACQELAIPYHVMSSSTLDIPEEIRGEERIVAICEAVGATSYVNAPGGRALYDERHFERRGIKLGFLPEYQGPYTSILERLAQEDPEVLRVEITRQCQLT